jgi:hypothetical protein
MENFNKTIDSIIQAISTAALSSELQSENDDYPSKNYRFSCKNCYFYTNKISNYNEHLNTAKHKLTSITNPAAEQDTTPPPEVLNSQPPENRKIYKCKKCNRPYFSNKGLWQHSKKCNVSSSNNTISSNNSTSDKTQTELITSTVTDIVNKRTMQMFGAVLLALKSNVNNIVTQENTNVPSHNTNNNLTVNGNMTNMNNNNNKTFNINMFLNEKCKDAMNMTDFVNTIELDTDDMEDVGRHGFVKGISKIFIENLEKTDVTKRPIHCSDVKREVVYIKDDDKWGRDNINSKKIVNAVRVIEKKNIELINKWAKEHPECENSDTQANSKYLKLAKSSDGDDESITKVIKNIAHKVIIDKNEYS